MQKLILLFVLINFQLISNIYSQCLPNGITFTTQSQINNFQADYPGCTKILGNVTIDDNISGSITNLNGLNSLNSIGGTLEIYGIYLLSDLTGLDNIDSISGDFKIGFCGSLLNVNELQSLKKVGRGLILWDNNNLTNIDSLDNLCYIGDYLIIGELESLISVNGLGNIESVGKLEIYRNASLKNLIGLGSLSTIKGDFKLDHNDSLINLSGLDSLNSILGDVAIKNNDRIANLNGLENLTYIGGHLDIGTNFGGQRYFKNLSGLENLTTVGGYLTIAHNDSLQTISSLQNLTSIGYDFSVYYNPSLINIDNLWNLDSIGRVLGIGFNSMLQDINSLANIRANSINALYINNNPELSNCAINSICEYIITPDAETSIYSNATNCNSEEEVKLACITGELPKSFSNTQISIFPNPTESAITIDIESDKIKEINIYNQFSQKVFKTTNIDGRIDLSDLSSGIYILEIKTDDGISSQKIIKK